MTVLDALRHQWRRQWRSSTRGRSVLATLLLLLAAAYFGFLFVAMGWFYPEVLAEVAPGRDPLQLLNEFLLYAFGGLAVSRFFFQRSAGSDVRAYLPLPIGQGQLVRVMQVTSAVSLFNLLPIVLLGTLWGSTVLVYASDLGAVYWAIGVLLALAGTQSANTLLRAVWDRHAGLVLGGGAVIVVVAVAGPVVGRGIVRPVSVWLFGGLANGHILPLLVLVGGALGLALTAHRTLRGRLYDVLGEPGRTGAPSGGVLLGRGRGWGRVAALALLDAKLILRNKRPRQMLLLGLIVLPFFVFLVVEGEMPSFNKVLFGFLLSGYLGLTYTQFGYAWHGRHFDGLLVQAEGLHTLVRAQVATFAGLCAGPLLLMAPVVAVFSPQLLAPLGAFFLYNLGVTAPVLLGLGVWARKALQIDQSAFFNYQGTSSYHFLAVLPVMGLPIALVAAFGMTVALLVSAGLGGVGLCTIPFWTRGLATVLRGQRHAMAAGFRETD